MDTPDEEEELRLEVFSPPYLFRGPRPTITAAPDQATYGETVTISTPSASTIKSVSLVRNGVTTHSFDSEQRLVDLPITGRAEAAIQASSAGQP